MDQDIAEAIVEFQRLKKRIKAHQARLKILREQYEKLSTKPLDQPTQDEKTRNIAETEKLILLINNETKFSQKSLDDANESVRKNAASIFREIEAFLEKADKSSPTYASESQRLLRRSALVTDTASAITLIPGISEGEDAFLKEMADNLRKQYRKLDSSTLYRPSDTRIAKTVADIAKTDRKIEERAKDNEKRDRRKLGAIKKIEEQKIQKIASDAEQRLKEQENSKQKYKSDIDVGKEKRRAEIKRAAEAESKTEEDQSPYEVPQYLTQGERKGRQLADNEDEESRRGLKIEEEEIAKKLLEDTVQHRIPEEVKLKRGSPRVSDLGREYKDKAADILRKGDLGSSRRIEEILASRRAAQIAKTIPPSYSADLAAKAIPEFPIEVADSLKPFVVIANSILSAVSSSANGEPIIRPDSVKRIQAIDSIMSLVQLMSNPTRLLADNLETTFSAGDFGYFVQPNGIKALSRMAALLENLPKWNKEIEKFNSDKVNDTKMSYVERAILTTVADMKSYCDVCLPSAGGICEALSKFDTSLTDNNARLDTLDGVATILRSTYKDSVLAGPITQLVAAIRPLMSNVDASRIRIPSLDSGDRSKIAEVEISGTGPERITYRVNKFEQLLQAATPDTMTKIAEFEKVSNNLAKKELETDELTSRLDKNVSEAGLLPEGESEERAKSNEEKDKIDAELTIKEEEKTKLKERLSGIKQSLEEKKIDPQSAARVFSREVIDEVVRLTADARGDLLKMSQRKGVTQSQKGDYEVVASSLQLAIDILRQRQKFPKTTRKWDVSELEEKNALFSVEWSGNGQLQADLKKLYGYLTYVISGQLSGGVINWFVQRLPGLRPSSKIVSYPIPITSSYLLEIPGIRSLPSIVNRDSLVLALLKLDVDKPRSWYDSFGKALGRVYGNLKEPRPDYDNLVSSVKTEVSESKMEIAFAKIVLEAVVNYRSVILNFLVRIFGGDVFKLSIEKGIRPPSIDDLANALIAVIPNLPTGFTVEPDKAAVAVFKRVEEFTSRQPSSQVMTQHIARALIAEAAIENSLKISEKLIQTGRSEKVWKLLEIGLKNTRDHEEYDEIIRSWVEIPRPDESEVSTEEREDESISG